MVAPSTQALLTEWNWEPTVLAGIAVLIGAYWYAVGPYRRKHHLGSPPTRSQILLFASGSLLLFLALCSPLDELGDSYLFSAHMVQHLLLATIWPPMMLLGLPEWLALRLLRLPGAGIFRALTQPALALILFNVDIYLWHLPPLYDATLTNEGVHILEHLTFMFFGLVNWWPVLSPIRSQRLAYPLQVLYLFADGMFMMVLGIVFTFSPIAFYAPYVAAPRLWGTTPVSDQQIGGLIMWYPGNLPYAVLLIVAFYRWFDSGSSMPVENPRVQTQSPTIGPPVP